MVGNMLHSYRPNFSLRHKFPLPLLLPLPQFFPTEADIILEIQPQYLYFHHDLPHNLFPSLFPLNPRRQCSTIKLRRRQRHFGFPLRLYSPRHLGNTTTSRKEITSLVFRQDGCNLHRFPIQEVNVQAVV